MFVDAIHTRKLVNDKHQVNVIKTTKQKLSSVGTPKAWLAPQAFHADLTPAHPSWHLESKAAVGPGSLDYHVMWEVNRSVLKVQSRLLPLIFNMPGVCDDLRVRMLLLLAASPEFHFHLFSLPSPPHLKSSPGRSSNTYLTARCMIMCCCYMLRNYRFYVVSHICCQNLLF